MIINDLFNNKKFVAEGQLDAGEDPYYFRVRHQTKRDIELEITMPKAWDAVGPAYATYEEAQAALKALQAKYPNERFTYTQHPRISNMGGTPHRAFPQGVAEGKKPDNYHIVNKDGKPASLASYADQASAEKDRDEKHPGAEVRQVGPRGKVKNVSEVSRGDYRNKAMVSQAGAKIKKFLDRDDPAAVASADQTIAKREKGLARADARVKAYTPPAAEPADLEKQQRDLTAKYPNIDELVRRAELNRDPNYEYADGQAYYTARDAEQNYQKLKQIQRVIQGLNESLD